MVLSIAFTIYTMESSKNTLKLMLNLSSLTTVYFTPSELILFPRYMLISNTRDSVLLGYPNTENRVDSTMGSGVFLTKFEVFG